ncbi:hypothetical protein HDA36_006218 [Nocardiopsis composta]|uniref:Uncharacterized protein n=1 Tax=Nocardiopsis composta TaxID=157465 RepID=A0A7W8QT29_9ACTN|nr:hypothetical protein [Nocardiopsis composta]
MRRALPFTLTVRVRPGRGGRCSQADWPWRRGNADAATPQLRLALPHTTGRPGLLPPLPSV